MAAAAVVLSAGPWAISAQQPRAEQKGPVFRVGAHMVTVDAYPTQGGEIVKGLTPADFEVFEDGKPQKVETLEFVDYGTALPDDDRSVRLSAREGLALAADSRYRVTVFVLDRQAMDRQTWPTLRASLLYYLRTLVDPRDLIGLVTTDDPWESVVLGRRLGEIEDQLADPEWLRTPYREDALVMAGCGMDNMLGRVRADNTFSLLEGLVRVLGQVREDRSNIVYVSNALPRVPPDRRDTDSRGIDLPRTSLVNGRIQRAGPDMHETYCRQERKRLNDIDFDRRFSDLTESARAANISFYPIGVWNPNVAVPAALAARGVQMPMRPPQEMVDSLLSLAKETLGFAVPPMGDVASGLKRISGDVGTHYLLGYYTTNTKWDGKVRTIRVRLKRTGSEIRARREYRAPTLEDLSGMSAASKAGGHIVAAPVATALSVLSAARPSAQFFAYGAVAGSTLYRDHRDAGDRGRGGALEGRCVDRPDRRNHRRRQRRHRPRPARGQRPRLAAGAARRHRAAVEPAGARACRRRVGHRAGPGRSRSVRARRRSPGVPLERARAGDSGRVVRLRPRREDCGSNGRCSAPSTAIDARLLDRLRLPLSFASPSRTSRRAACRRLVISTLSFTSLGRGDYVVELTARSGDRRNRTTSPSALTDPCRRSVLVCGAGHARTSRGGRRGRKGRKAVGCDQALNTGGARRGRHEGLPY